MKKFNKVIAGLLVIMMIIACSGYVFAAGPNESTRLYHIDLSVDVNLTFNRYVNGVLETKTTVAKLSNPTVAYMHESTDDLDQYAYTTATITLEENTSVDTDGRAEFMECRLDGTWKSGLQVTYFTKEQARHNGNFYFGGIATVTFDLTFTDPWTNESVTWEDQTYVENMTLEDNACPNYSMSDATRYGYDILITAEYLERLIEGDTSLTVRKKWVGDVPEVLPDIVVAIESNNPDAPTEIEITHDMWEIDGDIYYYNIEHLPEGIYNDDGNWIEYFYEVVGEKSVDGVEFVECHAEVNGITWVWDMSDNILYNYAEPSVPETEPETVPPEDPTEPETEPSVPETEPETEPSVPETVPPEEPTEPETEPSIPETEPETEPSVPETEPEIEPSEPEPYIPKTGDSNLVIASSIVILVFFAAGVILVVKRKIK